MILPQGDVGLRLGKIILRIGVWNFRIGVWNLHIGVQIFRIGSWRLGHDVPGHGISGLGKGNVDAFLASAGRAEEGGYGRMPLHTPP